MCFMMVLRVYFFMFQNVVDFRVLLPPPPAPLGENAQLLIVWVPCLVDFGAVLGREDFYIANTLRSTIILVVYFR